MNENMVSSLRQSAPALLACRSSFAGLLLQGRKNRRDARMNEKKDTKKRIREPSPGP